MFIKDVLEFAYLPIVHNKCFYFKVPTLCLHIDFIFLTSKLNKHLVNYILEISYENSKSFK